MPKEVLEEVELDFFGFTKTITVNTQSAVLYLPMPFHLYQNIVNGYWVFVKVAKGKYRFENITNSNIRRG